jgi:hypothetical protein
MRSISSAETALGNTECRQVRTEGTAPVSPAGMTPVLVKKRRNARIAVTGCPQLIGCRLAASRRTKSTTAAALSFCHSISA